MTSLARSNKHLSTAAKRDQAVRITVATSSAIEGIFAPFKRKADTKSATKGASIKRRKPSDSV